jgi:signal transduction histidine kinase
MEKKTPKYKMTLFWKFLGLIFTGYLSVTLVWVVSKKLGNADEIRMNVAGFHLNNYLGYVVKDLDNPVTREDTTKNLNKMRIKIEKDVQAIHDGSEHFSKKVLSYQNTMVTFRRGKAHLNYSHSNSQNNYVFTINFKEIFKENIHYLIIPTVLTLLIFMGIFMLARKILSPIFNLIGAMKRVRGGEIGITLPTRRLTGELKELVQGFNEMSLSLKQMIANKEKLLYELSHEFRSPLARINLSLEMLEDSKHRSHIKEEIMIANNLVEGVLEQAKITNDVNSIKMSSFDMAELLDKTCALYEFDTGEIKFGIKNGSKTTNFNGNKDKLARVFTNIIDNAIKYNNKEFFTLNVELDTSDKNHFTILFQDNGPGFPNDEIDYRLEFTKKDSESAKPGIGIGLSICNAIIKAHQGELLIENNDDGAIVKITLPKN